MNARTEVDAPLVVRTQDGPVATLTLNRGDRLNPLSLAMLEAIIAELDAVAADASARVLVITGAGRGFSAGHDMKELRALQGDEAGLQRLFGTCARMMMKLVELPQPVIAKVHGIATAAGCQLVSMCDLAVASEETRFAVSGVNYGLFCSTPAVGVARNVSRKAAMEMLLTGDFIDAPTARERGLVNRVVAREALDAEVAALADKIAARSAAAIRAGKRAFYRQIELSLADAYALATDTMVCNLGLADGVEGVAAFVEKRSPEWTHR